MKRRLKSVLIFTVICIVFSTVIAFATAGDSGDPLVTLSYITDVLVPDLDSRITKKVESSVKEAIQSQSSGESSSFVLVNVKAGNKIIGGEGTEFILRSGSGNIIATSQGGVADLTAGVDLANAAEVPKNHLMLVPRKDSRGMEFTMDGIVMVKGSYKVSKK